MTVNCGLYSVVVSCGCTLWWLIVVAHFGGWLWLYSTLWLWLNWLWLYIAVVVDCVWTFRLMCLKAMMGQWFQFLSSRIGLEFHRTGCHWIPSNQEFHWTNWIPLNSMESGIPLSVIWPGVLYSREQIKFSLEKLRKRSTFNFMYAHICTIQTTSTTTFQTQTVCRFKIPIFNAKKEWQH